MSSALHRLLNLICSVAQKKNYSIYFKDEKICSCRDWFQAEKHIKKMYAAVANQSSNTEEIHNLNLSNTIDTNCWKKFRNNFKIASE
jgi:hypothetical protein